MLAQIPLEPGAHLERRLSNAPWTPRVVARKRRVTAALVGLLALALFTAITPQGRAFAQGILQFFARTENNTRPVPTLALASNPAVPSQAPVSSIIGPRLPFEDDCGDIYSARCGMDEIRALVNFPVKGLRETAQDLVFSGATGGPEQVILLYHSDSVNGLLLVFAEPADAANPLPVAASAEVKVVSINGVPGEYVQGAWYSIGDVNGGISWTAESFAKTLRWDDDAVRYTMTFRAAKDTGVPLEKSDLLYMAERMTTEAVEIADTSAQPMEIQEISQQAGFTVVEPGWIPGGYSLLKAAYTSEQNAACLYYRYGEGVLPVLTIAQRLATDSILEDITISAVDGNGQRIAIPVLTESVVIGGAQAVLISNGISSGTLCPDKDFAGNQALYWQSNGKDYVIFGLINQYKGGVFLSRLEMLRLAENLTGVSTLSEGDLDPERLRSVAEAQSLAGFEVKSPSQMVAGLHLDHAAFYLASEENSRTLIDGPFDLAGGQTETVVFVYTPEGKPTRGGHDYGLFITQSAGDIRTLEEIHGWGGFDEVTINGQAAEYRLLCWDTLTGDTECHQELYWHENGIGYAFFAYLPGALERDVLIVIAESMR
jgi:hypothetical protein